VERSPGLFVFCSPDWERSTGVQSGID